MASSATVSAPKKRKSFSEYFHSMRGQQLIVTLVFLFVPLGWLFARFGLYYFWLTYPITEIITSAVGFAMFSRFGKNT